MDQETRLQALEITFGLMVSVLRDVREPDVNRACEMLRRALRRETELSLFPGEETRPSAFALERALVLLRALPLDAGQA